MAEATANQSRRVFIRLPEVRDMTGLSFNTIYRKAREGAFPKPVKLGERSSAWVLDEVTSWVDARIAARDAA